jgi:hypothetical protein
MVTVKLSCMPLLATGEKSRAAAKREEEERKRQEAAARKVGELRVPDTWLRSPQDTRMRCQSCLPA